MDTKELRGGLKKLRESIEDFLDLMEMDGEEAAPKKKSLDAVKDEFDHPNSKRDPSMHDEDAKKEH